ncbi:MAG: hydrolase 1, exosortase A system-associated [Novosphingobium sp.]|nr:hydrolase 1, exosortase A system-associated [Novosphingobium sp.]
MTRRHVTFDCEGSQLVGTIDAGNAATSGLLLVTGGNEVRSGAFAGQAQLAASLAAKGFAVMRFDRRGVGDSEGPNGEFRSSAPDIAAALAAFREHCPALNRVVGFGNCDGASALMLAQGGGCDALVLSNPWTFEGTGEDEQESPPEVVRDHYRKRLTDPAAIKRLLTGQVSLGKLFGSLIGALRPSAPPSSLAQDIANGIKHFAGDVTFLIADRDRTGKAFLAGWDKADPRIRVCPDATHAYVEPHAREWLEARLIEAL